MAAIRAYTDLQQSKKLAEILPLESADMRYAPFGDTHPWVWDEEVKLLENGAIPCWSLAALLDVFEDKGFFYKLYFDGVSNVLEVVNIDNPNIHEMNYNDYPIDVCYEMILKLHELKML